ncbi:MAG: HAMP domain-containing sensor histidine kinase [Gemmatimonadaceae bacterium]
MRRLSGSGSAVMWLQLLLVGGLATSAVALTEVYRASTSSHSVAARTLRDYANFAAWSVRDHLVVRIRDAIDEVLGPVNHGDGLHTSMRYPSAASLGHYFQWSDRCACHRPKRGPLPLRFLGFTLGADTVSVGVNYAAPAVLGWLADPPEGTMHAINVTSMPNAEREFLNGELTHVARRPRSSWGYDLIVRTFEGTPRILAMRTMPTQWGDTIVYAVEYSASALDSLVANIMATTDILPPSLVDTRSTTDLVDLEVSDASANLLFANRHTTRWGPYGTAKLPDSYGGLVVRAQLKPELAESLVIGGVPVSRVPLLLVVVLVALGLTVLAAIQLRRDVRFATERANFVANVSHELRTPLAQVRLVIDTLRLGRVGDDGARTSALGVADREVLRLQHLVEGLLRFARGSRRADTPRVRTDVGQEARDIALEFQPLAEPRGVRIAVEVDGKVEANLQQGALRQILLNLLDNAVKYGPEHSVITVSVAQRPDGGAQLSVSDRGPGVKATDRDKIWKPFERGAVARTSGAGGSGIGLTIVQELANEHGGRAWVTDQPGGGARFMVELPDA